MTQKKPQQRTVCRNSIIGLILIGIIIFGSHQVIFPKLIKYFGPPDPGLNFFQNWWYGFRLIWFTDELTTPVEKEPKELIFIIEPGSDAYTISQQLEQSMIIRNGEAFLLFLAWSGKDSRLQPGRYRLDSSLSALSIAENLVSPSFSDISFSILPGWRIEEIADTLATSGLSISADEFLDTAYSYSSSDLLADGMSAEGYLFPGQYFLSRSTTVDQLMEILLQEFKFQLIPEFQSEYFLRGLTLHEAVTLASIVQREAVVESEMPIIASVFYNRLEIGMKLQSDPTVQYALGYDATGKSWWKTPLNYVDLEFNSPYNTYINPGIPPGPISNPGLTALAAIAYPLDTPYFYFQAQCNESGYHNFAITYEEHLGNNCP